MNMRCQANYELEGINGQQLLQGETQFSYPLFDSDSKLMNARLWETKEWSHVTLVKRASNNQLYVRTIGRF